jgi:hypothetical protein
MLNSKLGRPPKLPLRVLITRCGPRRLDTDNLASTCKDVQDAVADWIGKDDGDPKFTWDYAQKSSPKPYVYVEIFDRKPREISVRVGTGKLLTVVAESHEKAVASCIKLGGTLCRDGESTPIYIEDNNQCYYCTATVDLRVRLDLWS